MPVNRFRSRQLCEPDPRFAYPNPFLESVAWHPRKEVLLRARPEDVWLQRCAMSGNPQSPVARFVVDAALDGGCQNRHFANGGRARIESWISTARSPLVWAAVGVADHHTASVQVFPRVLRGRRSWDALIFCRTSCADH